MENSTKTTNHNNPDCDICKANGHQVKAMYDANIRGLGWAYVCEPHFDDYNCQVGAGLGQELV